MAACQANWHFLPPLRADGSRERAPGDRLRICFVIASAAKQSISPQDKCGLLRRYRASGIWAAANQPDGQITKILSSK
jgi:hypothetical protein